VTLWRIGSDRVTRFRVRDDHHHFQFLQLAGDFLLWYAGAASSVLDVRTGNAFDVHGTLAGSPDRIAVAEYVGTPTAQGEPGPSRVSIIPVQAAPKITNCSTGGR
jgi:hypothetical protein